MSYEIVLASLAGNLALRSEAQHLEDSKPR